MRVENRFEGRAAYTTVSKEPVAYPCDMQIGEGGLLVSRLEAIQAWAGAYCRPTLYSWELPSAVNCLKLQVCLVSLQEVCRVRGAQDKALRLLCQAGFLLALFGLLSQD